MYISCKCNDFLYDIQMLYTCVYIQAYTHRLINMFKIYIHIWILPYIQIYDFVYQFVSTIICKYKQILKSFNCIFIRNYVHIFMIRFMIRINTCILLVYSYVKYCVSVVSAMISYMI